MAYDSKYTPTAAVSSTPQNIIMEGRSRLSVSGVSNVLTYDENEILMETSKGPLRVKGSGLHMAKLTLETGEALMDGTFDSLTYEDASAGGEGFFARLFK